MNLTLCLPLNSLCLDKLVVQLEVHLQGFHCQNKTFKTSFCAVILLIAPSPNVAHNLRKPDKALMPSSKSAKTFLGF